MNTDLGSVNLNPTAYSTDPILEYMYDTPADAIAQANLWGCSGYRVYLINGQLKYVPCLLSSDYQAATKLNIEQGAIVAQGKEVFGDKLVGYQFTEKDNIKGEPIFTLGNFSITTQITDKQNIAYTLPDSKRTYTALDFTTDGIEALKSQIIQNVTAKIKFDKSNLEKYVTYESLRERFRIAIQEVIETFPASLHAIPTSIPYPDVYDYYAYPNDSSATFRIRIGNIQNPFNIDYFKSGATAPQPEYIAPLRNFTLNYSKYVLYYKGVNYPIIAMTPPNGRQDANNLLITVVGNPFKNDVTISGTANVNFYIKPIQEEIDKFYENATDLVAYLLNVDSNPKYQAVLKVPNRQDDGTFLIVPMSVTFPMYDEFNVDIENEPFETYVNQLYNLADQFDLYKTDLIARFLTTSSLQEYDTDDRRTYVTLQAYGAMFDNVKRYADGIAYMTNVSYDAIDNVPDVLLKNFAHTIGWKTYEIENDETLVQSLFDVNTVTGSTLTPPEVDIELWRRIIINSHYLFKSKGTRKAIEFALELVGIPLEIMDINEYVYVAEHALDYAYYFNIFHSNLANHPIDKDGYPTTPPYVYFQALGGNMLKNAQNIGPYDNGKSYMDTYRKFNKVKAFDLNRVADNKKSWVVTHTGATQSYDLLLRDTNYEIKDSRLVINSKEADAAISSAMTMDYYVYSFYAKYGYTISVSGATVDPSALTFNDYLRDITTKLINPRNRKVIAKYPVLSKIYWDYLQYAESKGLKTIDYNTTLDFISKFDSYWVKLVQQFIPATTIFLAGKKFTNAEVTRSKFAYKHGLNDAKAWLGTDGSEFQDDALKPSPNGYIDIFKYEGYLGAKLHTNDIVLHINCQLTPPARAFLIRGGTFDADNYGFYRHNQAMNNVLELGHANYGTMSDLGTGINSKTNLLYFATNAGLAGSTLVGHMVTTSGSTYDDNLGAGYYAGMVDTGTTGSTKVVLGALPTTGDTIYPLQKIIIMGLRNVPTEPNMEYYLEGDIMFTNDVSGNTAFSYVALLPLMTGITTPSGFITDRDLMEGCLGKVSYDKYNWIHLRTKFQANQHHVQSVLVAQDIYYTGTTTLYLQNFTVTAVPTDINFITPPPLPHVCYFDNTGDTVTPFADMLDHPNFTDFYMSWAGSMNGNAGIPQISFGSGATDDFWITSFRYSSGAGSGGVNQSYDSAQVTLAPAANTLYYWSFDVSVTGSTLVPYLNQPTIYFHPFMDDDFAGDAYPFKFKGDLNRDVTTFEGYYLPTTMGANPHPVFSVRNNRTLTATTGNFTVQISNFKLKKVNLYYIDENNVKYWYRQPHAFGYSMNTGATEPDIVLGGSAGDWIVPFLPLGTGYTGQVGDVAGMYEGYFDLVKTFPLMHTSQAYVNKYNLAVTDSYIDINLTQACGLAYKFYESGTYPAFCITPRGLTVENTLFMSGAMSYTFDGFYPTLEMLDAGLGPFYTPKTTYGIYTTLGISDTVCYKKKNNYVPFSNAYSDTWADLAADTGYTDTHDVPPDFKSSLSTVSLSTRGEVRYMTITRYNLIKTEASLIYDSDSDTEQTVIVRLMGAKGVVYNQQSYKRGGANNPAYQSIASRTINYSFEGYYYGNDEVYLVVFPTDFDCVIRSGEEQNIVGGYILSGATGSTFSYFKADKIVGSMDNQYTYFTGDTYQYMMNSVYDILRFRPTGIKGSVPANAKLSEHTEVYDKNFEFFMCYVSGATQTGATITLQSGAVDKSNYPTTNSYIYAIRQLPAPFTGVTWTTYTNAGVPDPTWYYETLTGTTYSITRKSYVKIYESNVTGTTATLEQHLIAFYKNMNRTYYKYGYNKNFLDDPINRFFDASDNTTREVFPYGSASVRAEKDGIYLRYNFAKDLAGYPKTGEFIGRLTGKDPCGNFVTIYLLLFLDLQNNSFIIRTSNANSAVAVQGGSSTA